jgi:methylthioribose-1-phosphate isomerase
VRATVKPVDWRDRTLTLLDQRLLPHREEYVHLTTAAEVADAIREMVVRGAPAIGVAAAFGMVLAAYDAASREGRDSVIDTSASQREEISSSALDSLQSAASILRAARPTAVNLGWAIDELLTVAAQHPEAAKRAAAMEERAIAIFDQDVAANRRIGELGAALLADKVTLLTHCNAGALATAGYGTALGVVRAAVEAGKRVAVFADETRPWLQGSRLTAWELQRDGIDVTLITDNMAGHFFQQGTFDAVVVGADRIAANGDAANKIGTYTVAVLAHAHGVPFYVAAPWSTVDLACPSGADIPIEERSAVEVLEAKGLDRNGELVSVRIAPEGVASRHPAFDVTPSRLITAIITERGVARAPYEKSLSDLR